MVVTTVMNLKFLLISVCRVSVSLSHCCHDTRTVITGCSLLSLSLSFLFKRHNLCSSWAQLCCVWPSGNMLVTTFPVLRSRWAPGGSWVWSPGLLPPLLLPFCLGSKNWPSPLGAGGGGWEFDLVRQCCSCPPVKCWCELGVRPSGWKVDARGGA